MQVDEAIERVRRVIGDDVEGKCYVVAEAIYRLAGGKESGLMAVQGPAPEGPYETHWWLKRKDDGSIIDLTAGQYSVPVDYAAGKGRGFRNPSKAAAALMAEAGEVGTQLAPVVPIIGAVATEQRQRRNADAFDQARRERAGQTASVIVTQSEMACFMRDPRHWWLSYYRRLRKVRYYPHTSSVGSFYHAGLEALYRDNADPLAVVEAKVKAILDEFDEDTPSNLADDLLKAAEMAAIMVEGYMEWREERGSDVGLTILGAEQKVEVPLQGTPFILRGKMDARVLVEATGFRAQLEHKSVQSFDERVRYAQSDFQLLTYDLLAYLEARATDDETIRTDGVILNMGRRVKRTARATPPFYKRHEVRHNVQELRSHWKHVVAIATAIHTARQRLDAGEDHHVVVPPRVSRESGWSNPFLPVYPLLDDGSDAEGYLRAEFEEYDPLERYEETEDV